MDSWLEGETDPTRMPGKVAGHGARSDDDPDLDHGPPPDRAIQRAGVGPADRSGRRLSHDHGPEPPLVSPRERDAVRAPDAPRDWSHASGGGLLARDDRPPKSSACDASARVD